MLCPITNTGGVLDWDAHPPCGGVRSVEDGSGNNVGSDNGGCGGGDCGGGGNSNSNSNSDGGSSKAGHTRYPNGFLEGNLINSHLNLEFFFVLRGMTPSPSPTELQGWFGERPDLSSLSTYF